MVTGNRAVNGSAEVARTKPELDRSIQILQARAVGPPATAQQAILQSVRPLPHRPSLHLPAQRYFLESELSLHQTARIFCGEGVRLERLPRQRAGSLSGTETQLLQREISI